MKTKKILDQAIEAVENGEMLGICLACGAIHDDAVEPDASEYECQECGQCKVYGAELIMIMYVA